MDPIKTCVLGVGLSGLTFHIPFLLALPELFTLHSVLERNPKSPGGRVHERFGVTVKIHRSFEDVLGDDEIGLIVVGTPNATHYGFVKASLNAGKHVLVEKPAFPTSAEAKELGDLAASKKLVLYAYQNCRWNADFLALRRLLSEPPESKFSLGDVVDFESHYDRFRNELKGNWKEADLPGAGQVYNLGSHIIDQAVSLFGRPHKVTAFIENVRRLGDSKVDDSVGGSANMAWLQNSVFTLPPEQFTIICQYPERTYPMTVLLRAHILSVRSPQLRFVVRGTKGTFTKYGLDVQEDQLKAMANPSGIFDDDYGREPEDIWGFVENHDESGEIKRSRWPSSENGAYIELFKNLAGVIRGTSEQVVKWDEVVATLEVIEAAHQSSREGRTIDLL